MNKSLPNTNQKAFTLINRRTIKGNSQGFTLIELLVVISIIAIISVVGIAVFQGQQKNARDARRRADIESIAQAMESQKVAGSATYPALAATYFSSGSIPVDPTNTTVAPDTTCPGVCKYCVKASTGTCSIADTAVGAAQPPAGATWTVCANLEAGGSFCRSNSQ